MKTSINEIAIAPENIPKTTGKIPPFLIPGNIKLVKLAVSITPAAKPKPISKNF